MPDQEDESLATLLTVDQRAELSLLVANTTESMRDGLVKAFIITESSSSSKPEVSDGTNTKNTLTSQDGSSAPAKPQVQLSKEDQENEDRLRKEREVALSEPEVQQLKVAALEYFDKWRDGVVLRVGEVLNSRDHAEKAKDGGHAKKVAQSGAGKTAEIAENVERQDFIDKTLVKAYPPQQTSLAALSHGERFTILNAILLLLLSLEKYNAHSRTLMLRLTSSLKISCSEVTKMEKDVAFGLLSAASHMDGSESASAAQKANATSRKWKVGLASVAGAALIGVTGGLAAPLVAAGVGGLMGGLGLGATAAAGYLGTLAGSGVLVGGLFGAYGGKMTGEMVDAYAKEVQDFAFMPVKGVEKDQEKAKQKRRLRVTVGVSGWLTKEDEAVAPWKVLDDGGEPFALRFELKALAALGNALENFVKSYAWGYIKKEIISRTILAGLWSALMLPLGILKISRLVDNPFSVAKARSEKAGEVLADALINKAQGERPVSLIGYSLGSRVIYSCLLSLARRKAFGLVDSVVLMGAPMPSDAEDWRTLRAVVSGRLINVYSEKDYILAYLYRTSSIQLGVAGIQPVEGVSGIENVDVKDSVSGHLQYRYLVGDLLTKVGWADIDDKELQIEKRVLQRVAAEEEKREKEAAEAGGELDEKKLEADEKKMTVNLPKQSEQRHEEHHEAHSFQLPHRHAM